MVTQPGKIMRQAIASSSLSQRLSLACRWCEVVLVEGSKEEAPEQQLRRSVHVASRVPPTLKHEAEMYRQIFEQ